MAVAMRYELGLRAENYFLSTMNKLGLKTNFDDSWYDFKVNKEKVEVKSCSLLIKQNKIKICRSGRFHFTNKENKKKQFRANVWVCFIVRHQDDFMLLGFIRAKELNKREQVNLTQLGNYKLLTLKQWIEEIN